jgi:deoxycytidine triphosphate deaminase
MAKILPDHEIKKLVGSIILGAEEKNINPNGIELRLGPYVHFCSTDEEKTLEPTQFLKVSPGESVLVSSLETLDFTAETVQSIYKESMLMAIITPTTTIMREGVSQVSTKVDAGFRGRLNWAFRNSSINEFVIQYGEPIFKLTIFLLGKDESPETPYGQGESHQYQDTDKIKLSTRRVPSQIPKTAIVSSTKENIDPKKQLREAGYPFDHIGTELVQLQGKFEIVSQDVITLKDHFQKQTDALSAKIGSETQAIYSRLDEFKKSFFERADILFQQKFLWVIGVFLASVTLMGGAYKYLQEQKVDACTIIIICVFAAVAILAIIWIITHRFIK